MGGVNPQGMPTGSHHQWLFATCLALLLALFAAAVTGSVPAPTPAVRVAMAPLPAAVSGATSDEASALLSFTLPEHADDGARWVVWLPRDPVTSVSLRRGGWHGATRDFFRPGADEGQLPNGYLFPLPLSWHGDIVIEMHVEGAIRDVLPARVMREDEALRMEQYGVMIAATVYASLFTIALLALALFWASHDRVFLAMFGLMLFTVLTLSALNGHLYALPGLGAFSFWGEFGLWAMILLFSAGWLQMLSRYAGWSLTAPAAKRIVDWLCAGLAAFAMLSLLNIAMLGPSLRAITTVLWIVSLVVSLGILFDAGRRRIAMAWPLAVLALLLGVAASWMVFSGRGGHHDAFLLRYGYQLCLVASSAIFAVALIDRIGEYRNQRDRDRLARADTERRMQREAARSDLVAELQTRLRALPAGEIEWSGFQLLIEKLMPLMAVESCAVLTHGYHGHDVIVVEPASVRDEIIGDTGKRSLALKRQTSNGIPLQQPVTSERAHSVVAMEAVIPLQIRSPAWGVLLLRRPGAVGFTTEELSLAGEFARLTLLQIDQAVAAINLRRSAEVDALTGSFNRRTIDQWLVRAFAEAQRDNHPVSVLFIDLDHFKSINDRHGHACGDFCLRNVAASLRAALPEGDMLGRYGGEEFIVVLPGRGGAAAREIAEQLRAAVENGVYNWHGRAIGLTVSVGVATRREGESSPAAATERADKALYAAKRAGRNCVQVAPAVFS